MIEEHGRQERKKKKKTEYTHTRSRSPSFLSLLVDIANCIELGRRIYKRARVCVWANPCGVHTNEDK